MTSRYDYRDPGQDPAYCDPLSDPPEPERCETCDADIEGTVYVRTSGSRYAFCCESCYLAFVKTQEGA